MMAASSWLLVRGRGPLLPRLAAKGKSTWNSLVPIPLNLQPLRIYVTLDEKRKSRRVRTPVKVVQLADDRTYSRKLVYLGRLPQYSTTSRWREIRSYKNYMVIGSEASRHGVQIFDMTKVGNSPSITDEQIC